MLRRCLCLWLCALWSRTPSGRVCRSCVRCSGQQYGPPWAQVLGLTVLAWGNSIGDFSTNMAMAKKGLANMALTACYAGPVFNLLVRLTVH